MAARKNNNDAQKETALEAGFGFGAVLLVLFGLIWFLSSHKIVYYSTPALRWMGAPWAFFNDGKWAAINEAFVFFRNTPQKVPLGNFFSFANDCLRPLAVLVSVASAAYLFKRVTEKAGSGELRRQLDPMQAAREIAKVFPAILPVLHLGPDLVADKLPLWRRQTFPEDVWLNEKVNGLPIARGPNIYRDRVDTYFRGGEVKDGPHQKRNGRRWSKMLGFLAVDLIVDAAKQESICFPDRFSAQGKVMFALLCAHAFGGREGKADYQKACNQINRTCTGQANGLPNLTVAQWLYSKYRLHKSARKLFAVHHWEFTYLFSLFLKAKISGKATHTDFIWLKPMDRVLFYALNTVGRAVPHTEAGSVFAIFDYEVKCARYKRLPLRTRLDGTMEANICIYTASEGFCKDFAWYQASTEDDENWWMNLQTWDAAKRMSQQESSMKKEMDAIKANKLLIATLPASPDTPYDLAMNAQRKKEQDAQDEAALEAFGAKTGLTEKSGKSGALKDPKDVLDIFD